MFEQRWLTCCARNSLHGMEASSICYCVECHCHLVARPGYKHLKVVMHWAGRHHTPVDCCSLQGLGCHVDCVVALCSCCLSVHMPLLLRGILLYVCLCSAGCFSFAVIIPCINRYTVSSVGANLYEQACCRSTTGSHMGSSWCAGPGAQILCVLPIEALYCMQLHDDAAAAAAGCTVCHAATCFVMGQDVVSCTPLCQCTRMSSYLVYWRVSSGWNLQSAADSTAAHSTQSSMLLARYAPFEPFYEHGSMLYFVQACQVHACSL